MFGSQQQILLQQVPSKQKTNEEPPHIQLLPFGSVIFTANAQPLHVLIAALKTMISGRMPGEVSLCGYWTDSSMYCPCTEFSYTPNNLTIAICLGPWVLLKGNYKSSISFLLRSIFVGVWLNSHGFSGKKRVDIDFSRSFCQGCDPTITMNQAACTPLYKTHRYITPQKLGEVWKIRFFSASFRRFLGGETKRGTRGRSCHKLKPKEPGHSATRDYQKLGWGWLCYNGRLKASNSHKFYVTLSTNQIHLRHRAVWEVPLLQLHPRQHLRRWHRCNWFLGMIFLEL